MLTLPDGHRSLFRDPFGTLYPSVEEILPLLLDTMVIMVGDVVTHNVRKRGIIPAVAIVDGYTMREPCRRMPEIVGNCIQVKNPAGTITEDLIRALDAAVKNPPSTIIVDGEEDLAVIPMVIAAPVGSVILYGQPKKGVVLRTVTLEAQKIAREYLGHFVKTPET